MEEEHKTSDKRPWGFWPTFGFGIAIMVVDLITTVLTSIIFTLIKVATQPNLDPLQLSDTNAGLLVSLCGVYTTIIGVGLIIVFIIIRKRISIPEYLGLKPVSTKAMFLSLAIVACLIIANDTTCIIIGRPINPQVMVDMYNTSVWPALFWIAVIIFVPIFEETFFRGFLFKGFSYSRLGVIGTIVLTLLVGPYCTNNMKFLN